MWFSKCTLNLDFLIGIFRFSSDSALAWMPLGLIHDKSLLLQEWLGAIIQQAITHGITGANVDRDICCHMVFLLYRMSYSQTRDPSLLTYLRPRQNGRHFAEGMLKYIFTLQPLRAPGYCRTPSGRAAGQTSPVNTLTSIIFHGSFSNLTRTFITLRSLTSLIMEVLPH